ncbi:MAG: hypothetical protein KIT10_04775 [Flavobacteriales bacterium]|nr:hypothetical protein [Flavobacteriales bacterium]
MPRIFNTIRQRLLKENRLTRYLVYAVGEILLVVIGILIALQVNNYRESQHTKAREKVFLHGLRSDLRLNITELERSIDMYSTAVRSASIMIDCFERRHELSPDSFSYHTINVLYREPFHRNNSTMKELISSGNLGLLADDSLKNELLRMELGYDRIDFFQDHIRHDYEEYLYSTFFRIGDIGQTFKTYLAMATAGDRTGTTPMAPEVIALLLSDRAYKNGFSLCVINGQGIIALLQDMVLSTEQALARIDAQLNR